MILNLINFRKGTIANELSQFSKAINGQDALPIVTPAAFCKARQKLKHEVFVTLKDQAMEAFEAHFSTHRWHGHRLLAVDGSTGRLPNEAGLAKKFGGPSDATCPMVRFSRLYDVLNKVVVHADMEPYDTGEREIAAKYLYEVNDQDLVLYDRGYAAFWLFAMHRDMNKTYCARVKTTYSKEIKAFLESGKKSDIVLLKPNAKALTQCNEYYISEAPVRVRLVRVALGKGRTEVLVTSLLDEKAYPTYWFKKLYSLRWGVEENYKREKQRIEIENFSGRSVEVICQDFHAKILALNLSAMVVWVAQAIAERVYKDRAKNYQINFANAISVLKNDLVSYINQRSPWGMLLRLLSEIIRSVEPVVPGRSYPRIFHKRVGSFFYGNYKRTQ